MNVEELIKALSQYPPNMRVLVDGYEAGYDEIYVENITIKEPFLNVHSVWFYGPHDDSFICKEDTVGKLTERCLVIGR